MNLYIVRHGQTDWNKAVRLQGRSDIPLNEYGRELARKTGEGLKDVSFDLAFTSPLSRARETAELILKGKDVELIEDERIVEISFGKYEGRSWGEEHFNIPEDFQLFFTAPDRYEAQEGAENIRELAARTGEFMQELISNPEYADKNILVSTHGAALCGMLAYVDQTPLSEFWRGEVPKNCSVNLVEVRNGQPRIAMEGKVYYEE